MEQERRALLVEWMRLEKITVPIEQWPTYQDAHGRTLLEIVCGDLKYHMVMALFEAGCRVGSQVIFFRLICKVEVNERPKGSLCREISQLLLEQTLKEQIVISQSILDHLLDSSIFLFPGMAYCMKLIDLGTDCSRLGYGSIPSSSEIIIQIREYRQMVHQVRRRRCRAAVIALLGACGRWRKVREGALRDVAHAIGCAVWQARKQALWN